MFLSDKFCSMPERRSVPSNLELPNCPRKVAANLDLPLPFGPTKKLTYPSLFVENVVLFHGAGSSKLRVWVYMRDSR
jgi:hypothetical protein